MSEKPLDPDQIQSPYRQSSAAPATGGEIAVVLQLLDRVEPEGLLVQADAPQARTALAHEIRGLAGAAGLAKTCSARGLGMASDHACPERASVAVAGDFHDPISAAVEGVGVAGHRCAFTRMTTS